MPINYLAQVGEQLVEAVVRHLLIGLRHRRRGARRGAPPLGALV